MKTILAATITAVTVAGLSFGALAAPVSKMPMKPAMAMSHMHMHKVCKTVWHHHKKSTVCAWVK